MADSGHPAGSGKVPIPHLPPAASSKKSRVVKTQSQKKEYKKEEDRARNRTRINVSTAFERWRTLRDLKGFKFPCRTSYISVGQVSVFVFFYVVDSVL